MDLNHLLKLADQFEKQAQQITKQAGPPREFTSQDDLANLKGKPIYSAVFLAPDSTHQLLNWMQKTAGNLLPKLYAHHMTIQFKPGEVNVPVGQQVTLRVVGWNADDICQAAAVQCPAELGCTNPIPHITVSCSPEGNPKYSNDLLAKEVKPAPGPTLQGVVGVFGGAKKGA